MASIAAGIWSLVFMISFMNAFIGEYVSNQVRHETSHLQFHHPDFKKDLETRYVIHRGENLYKDLHSLPEVEAVSARAVCNGMINSPRKAQGIKIFGVVPEDEAAVLRMDSFMAGGTFFTGSKKNPIVIGYKTAERLKVDVNSKVVLTFQDIRGDMVSGAFRICGIIHAPSPTFNDMTVLVRRVDLSRLLGTGDDFHELAVKLKSTHTSIDSLKKVVDTKYAGLLAEDWKELSPELEFFQSSTTSFLWILQVIVMTALIFGIVNTMLMSVLERHREIGMLISIGMKRSKVFSMVMLETIFLSIAGIPAGLLLSILTMRYFKTEGVDLSAYSEGLEAYGYQNILHPFVHNETYYQVMAGVLITSVIAAVYPAIKAVRMKAIAALQQ